MKFFLNSYLPLNKLLVQKKIKSRILFAVFCSSGHFILHINVSH